MSPDQPTIDTGAPSKLPETACVGATKREDTEEEPQGLPHVSLQLEKGAVTDKSRLTGGAPNQKD